MTDYLLDTNILLRLVQPSAVVHTLAVEAVASLLANEDNVYITNTFAKKYSVKNLNHQTFLGIRHCLTKI
jgi:hypothetical protein